MKCSPKARSVCSLVARRPRRRRLLLLAATACCTSVVDAPGVGAAAVAFGFVVVSGCAFALAAAELPRPFFAMVAAALNRGKRKATITLS